MKVSYFKKRWLSFGHAFKGIKILWLSTPNARIHVFILLMVGFAGLIFQIRPVEWLVICLAAGMVLCAEALNSALEVSLNHLHPQQHEAIGKAKDLAAGGVLLAAIFAAAAGLIIFIPYLRNLL